MNLEKTIKYCWITPYKKLELKINIEGVYRIYFEGREVLNSISKPEAYNYFTVFKERAGG